MKKPVELSRNRRNKKIIYWIVFEFFFFFRKFFVLIIFCHLAKGKKFQNCGFEIFAMTIDWMKGNFCIFLAREKKISSLTLTSTHLQFGPRLVPTSSTMLIHILCIDRRVSQPDQSRLTPGYGLRRYIIYIYLASYSQFSLHIPLCKSTWRDHEALFSLLPMCI